MADNCPYWKNGRCVPPCGDENRCSYQAGDYDRCAVYTMVGASVRTGSALQGMIAAGVISPGTFVAGYGVVGETSRPAPFERQFPAWNYDAVRELDRISSELPIVPRETAERFFQEGARATGTDTKAVERQSGQIFDSLMGVVASSDRKDFTVTIEGGAGRIPNGLLMLETYDRAIGVLFCVARVSQTSFLTRAYLERDKAALKTLRWEVSPTPLQRSAPWWAFWR